MIALWAEDYTNRHIDLVFWRGEIPTTWFQSFNPFMIFAFTPFVIALWAHQAKRGTESSSVTKMAFGCFGVALANLLMVGAAWQSSGAPDASWLWLFGYFVIITIGELYSGVREGNERTALAAFLKSFEIILIDV